MQQRRAGWVRRGRQGRGRSPGGRAAGAASGAVLAWLAATDRRWLVVLDDLADPKDLRGRWPNGPGGRVLVTTRRQDAVLQGGGPPRNLKLSPQVADDHVAAVPTSAGTPATLGIRHRPST